MKKNLSCLLLAGIFLLGGCQSDEPVDAETTAAAETDAATTMLESSAPVYVWTTSAPDEPEEEQEYPFDISAYRLSAAIDQQMSEETRKDYMNLITTLMVGKDSIRMHVDSVDVCVQALYESFPCVWLIDSFTFVPDQPEEEEAASSDGEDEETVEASVPYGTMTITYQDNYLDKMGEFFTQTAKIMHVSGAVDAHTKDEAAILLYRYVASNITDWSGSTLSSYAAVMGIEDTDSGEKYPAGGTQAAVLSYLLLQSGIDSTIMTGELNGSLRAWCAFKLNGKWYYADPNCEMIDTGGQGMFFYGITDAYRKSEGYTNMNSCCPTLPEGLYTRFDGEGNAVEPADFSALDAVSADDQRYEVFRQSFHTEIKEDHSGIWVYYIGVDAPGEYTFS